MCCGRGRLQPRTTNSIPPRSDRIYAAGPQRQPSHVYFVYVGNTAMTVRGPVSGIEYRFASPGARVEVDARDRVLLASIRQLRLVG